MPLENALIDQRLMTVPYKQHITKEFYSQTHETFQRISLLFKRKLVCSNDGSINFVLQ